MNNVQILTDNFWDVLRDYDGACLTTNGEINAEGKAVMGRGIARQAALRDKQLPYVLARHLKLQGNHVGFLTIMGRVPHMTTILSYPVKRSWRDQADIELIKRSMGELLIMASTLGLKKVLLPVPGTANGRLEMEHVLTELLPIVDDRIWFISNGSKD